MKYNHAVTGLDQDEDSAWVEVESSEGRCRIEAEYIVGCGGAKKHSAAVTIWRASVSRPVLAYTDRHNKCMALYPPPKPKLKIPLQVYHEEFDRFGREDFNFEIDPEHWYMAGQLLGNIWRVMYGEDAGLSREKTASNISQRSSRRCF
jgi:hypothetical protein